MTTQKPEYGDEYQGAREDLAIWKRRALEAEEKLRQRPEPVAIVENSDYLTADELVGNNPRRLAVKEWHEGAILFTQPAPVVPDEMYWYDAPVEGITRAVAYATGWNNYRAAMLRIATTPVPELTSWPHRTVRLTFSHETVGDKRFAPMMFTAHQELGDHASPFTASNGVVIHWENMTSYGDTATPAPVADVVEWHKAGEERTCDIRWRRHDVEPGPLFTAPPAMANEVRQNRDLVMMVKLLARTVKKYNPSSQQAKDFIEYLNREGLISATDCLRTDATHVNKTSGVGHTFDIARDGAKDPE